MKRVLLGLLICLALRAADVVTVQIEYSPSVGAHVTVPNVGPGRLEVHRSTDLTNWVTFAIASEPNAFTNTWRFHDYLSTSNTAAFYRAFYTRSEPVFP